MGSTVNTMSEHDMHLLESAPFGRILPAMVTPMKSDGSVDFAAAQKLAKYLVADGADGLVVNGTTGESPVTHMDEKVELVRAVKEVVDVPVISGAGSNDTAHTVRMVEQTQEAGADAVTRRHALLFPPLAGRYRRPLQGRRRIRRKADHRLRCSRPYRLEGQGRNLRPTGRT